ncbi:proteasome complex subunit Rpn13 ubiquitin receptor-domain-containing protein [Amylostereum chailletii]|nr:proteasome complex subunit Rpn13 ubiquitin receptor-domain-containing protein [Amylostereum chailletii]
MATQSRHPLANPGTILAFKAGRAFRREGTNFVDPAPEKGALLIDREDDFLHLLWKDRQTHETIEDLILFPTDATFTRVEEAGDGRVYALKFSSSDQRHFFWMQDASDERDEEFASNVHSLLQIPGYVPVWHWRGGDQDAEVPDVDDSAQDGPSATGQSGQPTAEQLAQISSLVSQMSSGSAAASGEPELSLTDVLTPTNLAPLFTNHPELIPALFPHLPSDLPTQPSAEVLQQIINSPQFRAAVLSLDRALRTGMLSSLMGQLGLPEEAGLGVEAFLRAIAEQAQRDGDGMDTD